VATILALLALLPALHWFLGKAAWGWVALVLVGMVLLLGRLEGSQPAFEVGPLRKPWGMKAAWGSLLALGAFFLFYRFNGLPAWMDNDCANCLSDALYFTHGESKTPFKTVWGDNPALPYMLYGLSLKAFGISLGAAALVPALLHLAALPLYHGFCRMLIPGGGAWLAALLFACSRWMMNYVRMPREASLLPCFEAAALFFLARSIETGRKRDHALFGFFTALMLQTYLPSRLVLVLFLGSLAGLALFHRKHFTAGLPRWGLALSTFTLFFAPLGAWYSLQPALLTDRMSKINLFHVLREEGVWPTLGRFWSESFWMFNVRGGMDGHYNLPGAPMMDPVTGLFFWVGLAWCLSRSNRFSFLFVSSGFFLSFLGVLLANSPGHPMRAIATAPFVFLLAGLGADRVARAFSCLWPKAAGTLRSLVLSAAAITAIAWNFNGYFLRTPKDKVFLDANNHYEFLAAKALAKYPRGWDIHIDFDGAMMVYAYTYKRAEQRFFLPDFGLPIRKEPEYGTVVLLDGLGAVVEDLFKAYYPSATLLRVPFLDGRQALWLWDIPPGDIRKGLDRPSPMPGHGLWIVPRDAKGKEEGARWWPALFGVHKWARGWNLDRPGYSASFSLSQTRPLKFRVRGRLRVWIDGQEREGVFAEWEPKDLLLEALPSGARIRVDYSPDKGVHGLDLFWKEGDGFVPVPSGAYRALAPKVLAQGPKDLVPDQAHILKPDW
jgi:hypothetical protein